VRATTRVQITGTLGLCLLSIPVLQRASTRPGSPSSPRENMPQFPRPRCTPVDRTLREARAWQLRAWEVVGRECEALEEWDPEHRTRLDLVHWRLQQLARDRGGYLGRAREVARRAAALARTRQEAYRVALLLALIECDAGHHEAELQQARRLMALAPRKATSLVVLRRAAECNGLKPLGRWADAALQATTDTPHPAGGGAGEATW
jgi:hypothetical protein